jgi:hypothetical protein
LIIYVQIGDNSSANRNRGIHLLHPSAALQDPNIDIYSRWSLSKIVVRERENDEVEFNAPGELGRRKRNNSPTGVRRAATRRGIDEYGECASHDVPLS